MELYTDIIVYISNEVNNVLSNRFTQILRRGYAILEINAKLIPNQENVLPQVRKG